MVQLVKGLTSQANDLDFVLQAGGSHLGVILSPTQGSSLAMSGDTMSCYSREGTTGI